MSKLLEKVIPRHWFSMEALYSPSCMEQNKSFGYEDVENVRRDYENCRNQMQYDRYMVQRMEFLHTTNTLNVYILLPLCVIGIACNAIAAKWIVKYTRRGSAIKIFLMALCYFDVVQLLFTMHHAWPSLCFMFEINYNDNNFTFIERVCDWNHILAYPFGVISATIDTAHMWLMVALTAHRYWKIGAPIHSHVHDSGTKAKFIILTIIASAIAFRAPLWFEKRLHINDNGTLVTVATELNDNWLYQIIYYLILHPLYFHILPFIAMTFLNGFIIRELWLARRAIRKDSVYKHREQRATAAICVIVTLFLTLHSLFIYDIAVRIHLLLSTSYTPDEITMALAGHMAIILSALSSAINPLIYVAMGTSFRACHHHWQMWRHSHVSATSQQQNSAAGKVYRLTTRQSQQVIEATIDDHGRHLFPYLTLLEPAVTFTQFGQSPVLPKQRMRCGTTTSFGVSCATTISATVHSYRGSIRSTNSSSQPLLHHDYSAPNTPQPCVEQCGASESDEFLFEFYEPLNCSNNESQQLPLTAM